MDELIQQVTSKVGIDQAQARGAVETVVAFLKERLPAPVAAQLDGILTGGLGGLEQQAQGALGGLGGILGGDKPAGGAGGGF
jgi:uncharacterized protein (DUF2267 family)